LGPAGTSGWDQCGLTGQISLFWPFTTPGTSAPRPKIDHDFLEIPNSDPKAEARLHSRPILPDLIRLRCLGEKVRLGFAGIALPEVPMIQRAEQFAKKLHAYPLPRPEATNSCVRDLVDLVLLI
jgi:hypothetical protein